MTTLREDLAECVAELEKEAAEGETVLRLDSTIAGLKELLEEHQVPPYDVAGTSLRLTHDVWKPYDVVRNWHNEVHTGRLEGCQEQPCHAVAKLGDK